MTSIDELFQKSGLPGKRKLDPVRDPTEIYKSAKLSSAGRRSRHARTDADDHHDDDAEAGPARPPDDGEGEGAEDDGGDYGPAAPPPDEDEDDEGRFFGAGISNQEKEILDFLDDPETEARAAHAPAADKLDAAWLRRTALALERRIARNAEQRARYPDDPARFIESEADLDAELKTLSLLTDHPHLYPEFARLGAAARLVGLLAHDNTDIAIDAIEIVGELLDDDVPASDPQWSALADALLDADLLGLLASNLARLDEAHEADRAGVYHALAVLEALCSRPDAAEALGRHDALIRWLLARAARPEQPVSQNKQYAAEVLAILLQASPANRRRLASADAAEIDAVDALLQLVAPYRRRDPDKAVGEEEEFMGNLFEALTCLVDEPAGKDRFVDAEGVELCLLLLKEGRASRPPALRLLDHAVGVTASPAAAAVCRRVVEAGGLKTLFTAFVRRHDHRTTEHLVGIFAWMLRLLPADSPERIRTLAKFVEKDYEKTARLVQLRRDYAARLAAVDRQIDEERRARRDGKPDGEADDDDDDEEAALEDEWFLRRLDAGLFCLQTIDVILAWLIAEDDGARNKIRALLADRDETVELIRTSIQAQIDGIDVDTEEGKETRDMLSTLQEFLQ